MPALSRQVLWFIVVGCCAAATHWLVTVGVVGLAGTPPLLANVCGWLVAFTVSFSGHYFLTFRHQKAPLATAAWRFFLVSAAGFAINELAYAALLAVSTWRYDVLLAIVLVGVAGATFVASRLWAFRPAG